MFLMHTVVICRLVFAQIMPKIIVVAINLEVVKEFTCIANGFLGGNFSNLKNIIQI